MDGEKYLLSRKFVAEDGSMVEWRLWRGAPTAEKPNGLSYSLNFIIDGVRVLGYDDRSGKSCRHVLGQEEPYEFVTIKALLEDFQKDVKLLKARFL